LVHELGQQLHNKSMPRNCETLIYLPKPWNSERVCSPGIRLENNFQCTVLQ